MERTLIAYGNDARGRGYHVYDYGEDGWSSKTINGLLSSGDSYRYVCFYVGRVFTCGNEKDAVLREVRSATADSEYYGMEGCFVELPFGGNSN